MSNVRFELLNTCPKTNARRGRLITPHGTVETPAFMPVGTQATVKTVSSQDLENIGFEQILANTYHLALRPGADLIARFGGLHKFMNWKRAILTDSGGYQVMSLASQRVLSDKGVAFRSHIDGSELFLTPEKAIQIQAQLGVDISMALDVCAAYPCTRDEAVSAMERTHAWGSRNLSAARENQAVFGIVQGGIHEDLRQESATYLQTLPFDGFAIGGVSVGEPTQLQYPVVAFTAPLLPAEKVRYLMGVGHPRDILHAVECGVDLFDCVLPTRMARHHCLYTLQGRVNISGLKWAEFDDPVDEGSIFPEVGNYSAAYLRHLFKVKESLGGRLATLHNLHFYARLMSEIREAITSGTWEDLKLRYIKA